VSVLLTQPDRQSLAETLQAVLDDICAVAGCDRAEAAGHLADAYSGISKATLLRYAGLEKIEDTTLAILNDIISYGLAHRARREQRPLTLQELYVGHQSFPCSCGCGQPTKFQHVFKWVELAGDYLEGHGEALYNGRGVPE
jgi:hypothetical protein